MWNLPKFGSHFGFMAPKKFNNAPNHFTNGLIGLVVVENPRVDTKSVFKFASVQQIWGFMWNLTKFDAQFGFMEPKKPNNAPNHFTNGLIGLVVAGNPGVDSKLVFEFASVQQLWGFMRNLTKFDGHLRLMETPKFVEMPPITSILVLLDSLKWKTPG